MSALPPIADINPHRLECPLLANSGHWQVINRHRTLGALRYGRRSNLRHQELTPRDNLNVGNEEFKDILKMKVLRNARGSEAPVGIKGRSVQVQLIRRAPSMALGKSCHIFAADWSTCTVFTPLPVTVIVSAIMGIIGELMPKAPLPLIVIGCVGK